MGKGGGKGGKLEVEEERWKRQGGGEGGKGEMKLETGRWGRKGGGGGKEVVEERGRLKRKRGGGGKRGRMEGKGEVEKERRKGGGGITQNILRRKMNELNTRKYTLNKSLSAVF